VEGVLQLFLAKKSRRGYCINSGELAHFPRWSYCTFRDINLGCCSGMNFEGNRTTKGTKIEELICAFVREILAQILRSI
jgi:hypothetical protein